VCVYACVCVCVCVCVLHRARHCGCAIRGLYPDDGLHSAAVMLVMFEGIFGLQ
jgi:hypothetical protein